MKKVLVLLLLCSSSIFAKEETIQEKIREIYREHFIKAGRPVIFTGRVERSIKHLIKNRIEIISKEDHRPIIDALIKRGKKYEAHDEVILNYGNENIDSIEDFYEMLEADREKFITAAKEAVDQEKKLAEELQEAKNKLEEAYEKESLMLQRNKLKRKASRLEKKLSKLKEDIPILKYQAKLAGDDNAVTFIKLGRNYIKEVPKEAFARFKKLKGIDLGANQIEEVAPYAFANLEDLTVLLLSGNNYEKIPPSAFAKTPNLELLFIGATPMARQLAELFPNPETKANQDELVRALPKTKIRTVAINRKVIINLSKTVATVAFVYFALTYAGVAGGAATVVEAQVLAI